jgi:hypothetical protein
MDDILEHGRAYWESKLAGRTMPSRRDFDPLIETPKLLPWMLLTDVFRDPLDFRYRLIGTRIVERSRGDYTGKRFSELAHAGPESQVWRDRLAVMSSRAPLLAQPPYTGKFEEIRRVSGIHLPLSDDDAEVNMIMTIVVYS